VSASALAKRPQACFGSLKALSAHLVHLSTKRRCQKSTHRLKYIHNKKRNRYIQILPHCETRHSCVSEALLNKPVLPRPWNPHLFLVCQSIAREHMVVPWNGSTSRPGKERRSTLEVPSQTTLRQIKGPVMNRTLLHCGWQRI